MLNLIPITLWILILSLVNPAHSENIQKKPQAESRTLQIGNQQIVVEISDSNSLRQKGLAGRQSLPINHGMLFIFDSYVKTSFWMKGMLMDIDLIWIKDNRIIGLVENIRHPDKTQPKPQVIHPKRSYNRVVEVPAGWVKQNRIKIGDILK